MGINLEHIKTLDAIARCGSVSKASQKLNKVHSAVLYSMRSLEDLTQLKLFDRSGYRTRLTKFGQRLWQEARYLLEAEQGLEKLVQKMTGGWEPIIKVVFDGVLPLDFILGALRKLEKSGAPTKALFFTEYLSHVEEVYNRENADIMVTVLPPEHKGCLVEKILSIDLLLIAHRRHELIKAAQNRTLEDLKKYTFLTVRGSDFRLQLSTKRLEEASQFYLSDFYSKKQALLEGLGYGWMPEHLIKKELKSGVLKVVKWEGKSHHSLQTYLCSHVTGSNGRAVNIILEELKATMSI